MGNRSKSQMRGASNRSVIAIVIAAVASVAALAGNIEKISQLWCSHVGFVCTYDLKSPFVSEASGGTSRNGSDVCKAHQDEVCLRPSTSFRSVIPSSVRFEISQQSGGALLDGGPSGNDPIGTHRIGWFITSNSTSEACAIVFARTSACETTVSISGRLTAREKWMWRPW